MKQAFLIPVFLFAVQVAGLGAKAAEPTLSDVLKSTPKPANAVMHVDLSAMRTLTLGTPLEVDLPANVDRIRIAGELDFARLQPNWEIGYATMNTIPGPETVAQATGGYVEKVVNRDVVWTPNSMYLVPLPDRVLSIVRPSDRKFLSQWLRKDRNASSSEFLAAASALPLDPLALMIAVDIEDTISADTIVEVMQQFLSLKGKNVPVIARELAGLKGVLLKVSRDTLTRSEITLTFNAFPTELSKVSKEFFNELLRRRGSAMGDISAWKVTNNEGAKTIQFNGSIPPQVLDDVLGLFTVQRQTAAIEHHAKQPDVPPQETSQGTVAGNTKDYFKKLVNIIHRVRDYSADNTGDRAQWNGNMANRIDDIPTLNVDAEMVQFGAEVGKALRTNMMSMQLTNISTGAAAVANDAGTSGYTTATGFGTIAGARTGAYNSYYGGGQMGGNYTDPNSPMKYYMMGQAQGNAGFKQMMAQMEQAVSDMRRRMTEKYSVQF